MPSTLSYLCVCVCGACDWSFFWDPSKILFDKQIKSKDQFCTINRVNQLSTVNVSFLWFRFGYSFWTLPIDQICKYFYFVQNNEILLNDKVNKLQPIDQSNIYCTQFWCSIVKIFYIRFIISGTQHCNSNSNFTTRSSAILFSFSIIPWSGQRLLHFDFQ